MKSLEFLLQARSNGHQQTTEPEIDDMAKKTMPVRLSETAIRWARIASGYTGESMAEYVSRVVEERGKVDADRLHAEAMGKATIEPGPEPPKGKARRKGTSENATK